MAMGDEYVNTISSRYLQKWLSYDIKHVKNRHFSSVAARGPQSTWGPDPVPDNHCFYLTRRIWWARHSPLGVHLAKLLSFPGKEFSPSDLCPNDFLL